MSVQRHWNSRGKSSTGTTTTGHHYHYGNWVYGFFFARVTTATKYQHQPRKRNTNDSHTERHPHPTTYILGTLNALSSPPPATSSNPRFIDPKFSVNRISDVGYANGWWAYVDGASWMGGYSDAWAYDMDGWKDGMCICGKPGLKPYVMASGVPKGNTFCEGYCIGCGS